jgi:hypothetical protein
VRRGVLGPILLGFGAFALVAAALLRFYAYDQLAVAPKDQESTTVLVGPDATIFDTSVLEEVQTDLTITAYTVGDVEAAEEEGDDVVVWNTSSSTRNSDDVQLSASVERIAFDPFTAESVDCCGTFISDTEGEETPITRSGLLAKFPFGTEKRTYDWWDDDLGEAVPIDYVETEEIDGLETYKFEQTIEPTVVDTQEVPASVLGEDAEGNLPADFTYSNVRTLWVEPVTGVIIKRQEQQLNTIQYQGEDRVTTTEATVGYDEETVQNNIDEYGGEATKLKLVHTTGPLILVILGLVAIVIGSLLVLRNRGGDAAQGTGTRQEQYA